MTKRDINDALDELAPKEKGDGWRKTTKNDVIISGIGVIIIVALLVYRVIDEDEGGTRKVIAGLLGAVVLALQVRNFRAVLGKYRSGEDIQAAFFRDATRKRIRQHG